MMDGQDTILGILTAVAEGCCVLMAVRVKPDPESRQAVSWTARTPGSSVCGYIHGSIYTVGEWTVYTDKYNTRR